jgi:hypothetical protein
MVLDSLAILRSLRRPLTHRLEPNTLGCQTGMLNSCFFFGRSPVSDRLQQAPVAPDE